MNQQENVGESRNLHFTDAADRSRAQGLDQTRDAFSRAQNTLSYGPAVAGNPWKVSGKGPELDPDVEDQYRREKADYLD